MDRVYLESNDDDPGTPAGLAGVGVGYTQFSPYAHLSHPQPKDPQALCLHSYQDEQEALEACQQEWAAGKKKAKRGDKQAMAQRLLSVGKRPGHDFFEQLAAKLDEYKVAVPTVQIEYRNLTVRTEAMVGSAGIPTAGNFAPKLVQAALGLNKGSSRQLTILDNLQGVLKPGRVTLLLGPPGSGKTTFLKVLGNRLRGCNRLKVCGEVLYNGHTKDEFVVQRTTAYVDQHDSHISNMSVAETVDFAHTCHSGFGQPDFCLTGELCKAKVERSVADLEGQALTLRTLLTPPASPSAGSASSQAAAAAAAAQNAASKAPSAAASGAATPRGAAAAASLQSPSASRHGVRVAGWSPPPQIQKQQQQQHQWATDASEAGFNVSHLQSVMALDEIVDIVAQVWGSKAKTEVIMQLLGLGHCRDTKVGDGGLMVRGISGGERKRLTTAEMVVGPQRVLLMDEISTGLDSATLHSIITFFVTMSHALKMTTVISLLQPPPEVFNLFDDLMYLCEGKLLYHGPLECAVPHFTAAGFICPVRKDVASFLLEITTPTGQMEYASKQLLCAVHMNGGPAAPGGLLVGLDEMSSRYWAESAAGSGMLEALNKPFPRALSHPAALEQRKYALTAMQAVRVVTKRQMKLVWRDKVLLRGRMLQVFVVSLMVGSLFFRLGHKVNDTRSFLGAAFMAVLFMAMGSMPQIGVVMAQKAVWLKHRDSLLYPGFAHGVAMALSQLPVSVMEATLFSCIIYPMVGFHASSAYWMVFWAVITACNLCLSALFRLLAVLAPNPTLAAAYGGLALLILILTSGFAIVRGSIPAYWIWAYYISPFGYALRALVINEFTGPDWQARVWGIPGARTLGQAALMSFDFATSRVWITYGILFLIGAYLVLSALTCVALDIVTGPQQVARLPDPNQLQEVRAAAEKRRSMAQLQLQRAAERAVRRKSALSFGGTSSIISSITASIAGYRSRKNSLRGGANLSYSGAGAVAAGSFSALMSLTSAYGRRASSRANSASGAVGVGSAYANSRRTTTTLTAAAVAEKSANCEEESLHGSDSLGGSSDTSSNFGAEEYMSSALGMTFVPITLVFRDLRYYVPNPTSSSTGCWSWLSSQTAQLRDNITQSYTATAQSSGTNLGIEGVSGASGASKGPWQFVHYASSPTAVRRRTNSHPGKAHPISSDGSSSDGSSSSSSSSAIHVDILLPGGVAGPSGKHATAAAAAAGGGGQCDVPRELELLKGVSGFAQPGKLMALMGGSGAGKTTLMDVICGRKTVGRTRGELLANGQPIVKSSWSRVVGYVEQMDVHTPAQTVREALWFSGRLRLGTEVSDEQVRAYVEQVIDTVDLTDQSFSLVGLPGATGGGLSTEQLKRLTIAVELVANPSVVFMDEPTSGLDGRAAAIVMSAVRNVASSGRTVMVTIHQPSIEIFEAFDTLLLLQRGGRTTYFGPLGPESSLMVPYFQSVPGTVPLPAGHNPATWMLEVTGGSMAIATATNDVDWPAIYASSSLAAENAAQAEILVQAGLRSGMQLHMNSMYAQPPLVQLRELLLKYWLVYWRTPSYTLARCFLTLCVAFIYGSMYYKAAVLPKPYATIGNIQNIMGIMFSSTSFLGMTNLMAVMPLVGMERVVFYRERGALPYDPFAYGVAIALVEVPYLILQALLFVPVIYSMVGFSMVAEKAFYYGILFLASISFYTIFGQFMVYVTPSQQIAQVLGSGLNFLFNIFNGFVITYSTMPHYWQWLNRCVPTTWVLYGLGVSQLGDVTQLVSFAGRRVPVKTFVKGLFDYEYDMRWWCLAIVIVYVVFFRITSILALRYINFLKR